MLAKELPIAGRQKGREEGGASQVWYYKHDLSKIECWCHEVIKHGKTSLLWKRKRVCEAGPWPNTNQEKASPCCSHLAPGTLTVLIHTMWSCWPAMNNRVITGIWIANICLGPKNLKYILFLERYLAIQLLKAYYQDRKLHCSAHFESTHIFFLVL